MTTRRTRKPIQRKLDPEVAAQVLSLRRAGASFDAIADRLNLTHDVARAMFEQALASYDLELNVALEADRLDRLHMAVWPAAVAGDQGAVDRVLKISERRDRVVTYPVVNAHALREAFDRSAETSDRLVDGWDRALIEAGRKIADRVDAAVASGDGVEVTRALYLVPHMLNVLREMLATPASRAVAEARTPTPPEPKGKSKLATLRAVHDKPRTGLGGA